jgi:hypothetical protein
MKSTRLLFALFAAIALIHAAAASAANTIDMDDPRRVVGRENDVRIDAQLVQDTVSPGAPVGVTWQIQNFTAAPVAVAEKVAIASYDPDTATITLAIGSEVPRDGKMPHVVFVAPGEKKVFSAGATPIYNAAAIRSGMNAPRYVQVKVSILRDLTPFDKLQTGQTLSDSQFEQWFESNDTILLNTVPVRFSPRGANMFDAGGGRDATRR